MKLFYLYLVGFRDFKINGEWSIDSFWNKIVSSLIVRIFFGGELEWYIIGRKYIGLCIFLVFEKYGKIVIIRREELDGYC